MGLKRAEFNAVLNLIIANRLPVVKAQVVDFWPTILLIVFAFLAVLVNNIDLSGHTFTAGTMERMSTALLTTALVSSLGLCETYLEIYRNRVIVW